METVADSATVSGKSVKSPVILTPGTVWNPIQEFRMSNSNHRCEVVRLGEPAKHPNADSLEIFKVFDWDVVSRIGTWRPGHLAAYVVPDSLVDTARQEFAFLISANRPATTE